MCLATQQPASNSHAFMQAEANEHGDEINKATKHTPYAQLECGSAMGAVCGAAAAQQ